MFAVTADQRASRTAQDLVPATIREMHSRYGQHLLLPPDQNAGDEIQLITPEAPVALRILLDLTRSQQWSVGLGVGSIETPLPSATRMARGSALIAARSAALRAKRQPTRCAVASRSGLTAVDDAAALVALLITLRDKRSPQGWELYDLLESGLTQKEAAERLGVTPQAVGNRLSAAAIKVERDAHAAVVRALESADAAATNGERKNP